jgi:AcrR family transcriptional regulator
MSAAPSPARRTQAERSARTRERLIAAAIEALYRLGYAATSTALVADRAGVSRGAMLHQFPTKADLMAAVVRATFDADVAVYRAELTGIADPKDRFLCLIALAAERFRLPGGVAQTELWNASRSDPELAAAIVPIHHELDAGSRETFRLLYLQIVGREDHAAIAAIHALVLATLRGMALESAIGPDTASSDAAIRALQTMLSDRLDAARRSTPEPSPRAADDGRGPATPPADLG